MSMMIRLCVVVWEMNKKKKILFVSDVHSNWTLCCLMHEPMTMLTCNGLNRTIRKNISLARNIQFRQCICRVELFSLRAGSSTRISARNAMLHKYNWNSLSINRQRRGVQFVSTANTPRCVQVFVRDSTAHTSLDEKILEKYTITENGGRGERWWT